MTKNTDPQQSTPEMDPRQQKEPHAGHKFPVIKLRVLAAFAWLFLLVVGSSSVQAQMVTVNPVEAPGALTNPLMGFRGGSGPYVTVVQQYIPWSAIENQESDSVQKIRDYCNAQWANHPANNIRVIPRVYIDWDWNTGNENWPADLQKGDWTSQQFKDRVVRLVGRLGEVWNNDPRVAWVQTGLIGYWGEQEQPVGVGQDGWAQRLGDAYTAAFPNKPFIVRNMGAWPGYNVGVYWDSFGHPGQRPWAWAEIKNFNNQGRYLTQVIEGETALDWGVQGEFASLYGYRTYERQKKDSNGNLMFDAQGNPIMETIWTCEPEIILNDTQHTDNMINVIRELHCSALGWISGYEVNGEWGSDPNTVAANAARMQKEFGYRFHLSEFSCDARANPGSNLNFQFKVTNKGSAPMYQNWPLAVTLIDKNTRQLLWKATIPNVDIRKWHPGHDYNYTTRTYQTPAQEHLVSASIPLPANLPVGEHLIGLSVLEPFSRTPGLFFAVPNFFKESQTQPLAKIGSGMDATGHTLDGVVFDDLVSDDARSYTVTPQGPFYTLVAEYSDFGMISQQTPNDRYAKDTGVEVRAIGKLGYQFSSWGGVLAGSTANPAIIVMDGNKSVSANYVPVASYRLNTTSTNGTVTLSPPGGIYNVGTEVTVTAVPSSGYALGSWSGDLSGTASSTTITMTGDKNVTANFAIAPIVGPNSYRVNSGGPAYTAGDGALFIADTGGNTWFTSSPISGTTDDALYQTERYGGSFAYNIPLVNGDYEVTLMFAEIFSSTNGSRVFNVALEGIQVITNLDIHSIVGKNAAHIEQHMVNVTDGQLNIAFNAAVNGHNAKISAIKVTRIQRPNSFTLVSDATSGAVTSDPTAEFHDSGSVVTLTAMPNTGYKFDSWSGDFLGTVNPATVTMDGNKTVIANFSPITNSYSLSTSATHGSIASDPSGGVHVAGTAVTLTATPVAGYRFASWSGDLSGSTASTTITMDGNKNITANFVPLPEIQTVLLVVGSASGASDIAIRKRLESYGFIVQTIGDAAATTADATGKVLVITSSSVMSGNVTTKFRDVAVPVINWETALQDEYLFTTATAQGTLSAQTSLNIVNPSHPMAAGLPAGSLTVSNAPSGFSWGELPTSAIIIARLNSSPDHPCIYAYETGAAMNSGTAAARRVHLFLQNETFASLTADGRKLFDAAVSWALNQVLAGGPPGPSSIDYAEWATAHILLNGSSDDDKDGRTNYEEYVFGQNPKSGASVNPVSVSPSLSDRTISYTRRKSSLTALSYSVWYSNSLEPGSWIKDSGAIQGTPVISGDVETVPVTLSPVLLSNPKLFIQVRAE